ncbi:hypothetical protein V495_01397 [Pseudogymnoascus sp. VKM F-4514 (FW-929)]|nr:hypothetical protein V495_01397 [Pseudogymnoascus sp. VKM F-4514 (FW-929)]KFY54252.1 hypothetical protein V497_07846 [Pseudogymnoascus sp. VKM F-4516 (FW-969)]
MVQLPSGLTALSATDVNLYHTTDPLLSHLPVLVFHGASTTTNATLSSSRIQIHILSAAGFTSYPRLTVSPNSPLYDVVNELPREWQGDEVCRGLAFGLMKYFEEMPAAVKTALIVQSSHAKGRRPGSVQSLFGRQHAANLASSLVKVDNVAEVIADLEAGMQSQAVSHIDVDVVLPPGSITSLPEGQQEDIDDEAVDSTSLQYGPYAPLVRQFGEPAFIPTSKLRRAPSKPTSLNRSKSFLKNQKMSLRREMGELVDTEERYVIKVHELVNNIADEFRAKARKKAPGSASPTEKDLQKLFPPSLDKILQVNMGFLAAIQKCMDESEEEAMQDLENDQPAFSRPRYGGTGRPKDPTGATGFAKVLLEWFPQFADCYQDYIRASQDFPQIISTYSRQQSSFSQRVQQTGEQKLRSSVIEPVQRLPRYSLFIDNIVNYLPLTHPALQSMLKARDIITSICSLDSPDADNSQTVKRLKLLVDKWPTCVSKGRLISAVDFVELSPPFHGTVNTLTNSPGVLLLFAETLIVCRKAGGSNITARGVMAEVDKPSTASMVASVTGVNGERPPPELQLVSYHTLSDVRFTEGQDGRVTWMTLSTALDRQPSALPTKRAFLLQGSYEGKASKWTDEFTKARVEGRFAEKERESDKWSLRNVNSKETGLNIYAAVFEEGIDTLVEGRKEPAPIRIVVDHERGTKGAPVGHYGVETVVNVTVTHGKASAPYHLKFEGLNEQSFNDLADDSSFLSVFAKRVETLLQTHYSPKNPALTTSFILCYSSILSSLSLQLENDKAKYHRAPSPVKMLSSFLTGGGSSSSETTKHKRTPTLGSIPSFTAPSLSRSSSKKGMDSIVTSTNSSFKASFDESTTATANPLVKLEETFTGYIIALQSRKGNIIGRVLRNRAGADELSVNALYNKFIENPFDARASFEATVDVLFSAFEKFTRMAWKDQMGPVISVQTLQALQEKASKLFPGDFADYIKLIFGDMAPQNRRAFVAIIKLLADLLEGCGNDGDRGALTASFTELLVGNNDPHSYINLLDRLVEDADRLFEDLGVGASNGYNTPMDGSMTSRTQGSVTSNTSLRKRFGLDSLLRQNSKREDDSKPSMWRTLSKTGRSAATGEQMDGSISKGRLHRSRSIESDSRLGTPKRPGSRDRPTVLGAFDDQRPSSSHTPSRLSTIGQSPPAASDAAEKSLKKKRRSSLSDLKALLANATLDSPSTPLSTRRANQLAQATQASPRTPSPTKLPSRALAFNGSPKQKENANARLSPARNVGNLTERPHNVQSSDTVTIKDLWSAPSKSPPKTAANLASNIPTLKGSPRPLSLALAPAPVFGTPAFSEITNPRKDAGPTNIPSPTKSPQKLRLQSPQKLRERLQSEAKAIGEAEAGLQSELAKIGAEMAKLSGSPVRGTPSSSGLELRRISESVRALESRIPVVMKDLEGRNAAVQKDLDRGLVVAEEKVKGLDQLYREVSAENEILYERFNGELGRIVKALKGKGREEREELVKKVKESSEEAAAVRKENARLKREVLGLKALVKGSAL